MRTSRKLPLLAVVALALLWLILSGREDEGQDTRVSEGRAGEQGTQKETPEPEQRPGRPIGDGSTSDTGAQPGRMEVSKLAPGQRPPQFVVFSWDGAGEDDQALFSHFREVAKETNANMTFFLSGIYLLPESERDRYRPPGKPVGASDIGYLGDAEIRATLKQLRGAWLEGHEIGTHFNGHFCGPSGGSSWSEQDWISETEQARELVQTWRTTTGFTDIPPLPFDYSKELIGGRAPCLEGQQALLRAAPKLGFRYDASSPGGHQMWPQKVNGIWDLPLQQLPFPGNSFEVLSMDYNIMYNQSQTTTGSKAKHATWEDQAYETFMGGFERAYEGNRAPLLIGNHFESWNGGIYMKAIERTMRSVCTKPEVRCVSFRDLVDWLDAQDPKVLAKLSELQVGAKPDWASYLAGPQDKPTPSTPPKGPETAKAGVPRRGGRRLGDRAVWVRRN
ncbi:hypothetical protein SAMN05421630_105173 [Prauserella marina]|uniref:Uncharacterized protein n=1 Tax=Prauserella marina TaxID=530584 RepID=A0A1G6R8U7_9PSEU|nr:hypothetical protein [Prauserella marina]PWV76955.1 hypothetical protein DES30_105172 [Prauserella marina]SDD01080.1 hypothetical protein SAMN05421630_105173 [Prauserella marina]